MNQSIAAIAQLYKVNTLLFQKTLISVRAEEEFARPMGKGNSLNFVAGHMTASRFLIVKLLGFEDKCDWCSLYDMGAEIKEPSIYPTLDEIKKAWLDISQKLTDQFENVTDEILAAKPPFEIDGMEKSVRGVVTFLSLHESYHLGQLAYITRLFGHDRPFG